jgi:hypothetical protein
MRRTIADELKEEGAIENRQKILLRQLKLRFGDVPAVVSATIQATHAPEHLDEWLDRLVDAKSLDDMGIGSPS